MNGGGAPGLVPGRRRGSDLGTRYHRRVTENERSLEQRLEEIGAQLAWVRDYL